MENTNKDRISLFTTAQKKMVSKNESAWADPYSKYFSRREKLKDYSLKEIDSIINSGDLSAKIKLSRNYFNKDGFYRKLIMYYATLPKYTGVLIPSAGYGKSLATSHIKKKYYAAAEFIDKQFIQELFTKISISVLRDGAYYGVIKDLNKNEFVVIDLNPFYCRSNYVSLNGDEIVEFNVAYFNSIIDDNIRREVLALYPKEISDYYNLYKNGKVSVPWVKIPQDIGVCFSYTSNCLPAFLNVIPTTIQYEQSVDLEIDRDREEVRKIIVQHMPHLNDGQLVFEPPEAAEMHAGAVDMMKGNKNISILTTYADVDSVVSKTSADTASNNLEKMMQNIYYEAGTSSQIFSPTGNLAIETSIKNDMAFMMYLLYKYSRFLTQVINQVFSNININFKYEFLPINYYNENDYVNNSFKLAQSGYSFILPALAMGISQSELSNLKELENDVLKLGENLIPLQSSYTQSGSSGELGAPEKPLEEKSQKTIQNEESIDKTGGSN